MKNRSGIVLVTFALASCFAWAQQTSNQAASQAPTLADIARQNRSMKSKKVITSEDMKAAEPMPVPTPEGAAEAAAPVAAPKNPEAVAAAQAKVEDLRDREILLNKNIARFETSMATAAAEGNDDRRKNYAESLETARTALADTTQRRVTAEKDLDELKATAAAAAATAAEKKKPARKGTAPAPKS